MSVSDNLYAELVKKARASLQKAAFVPMDPSGASAPPPGDPAAGQPMAGGGAPPPPMDPSGGAGGMPPGGAPPMDPSGGAGGAPPPPPQGGGGMDPSQPIQVTLGDLMQLVQAMTGGGASPGGAPPGGAPPAGAAPAPDAGGAAPSAEPAKAGGKGKGKDEAMTAIKELSHKLDRFFAAMTGNPNGLGDAGAAGVAASAGAASGPPGANLGAGDAQTMGQGMDPSAMPPDPQVPGSPSAPPKTAQATRGEGDRLGRIISNLRGNR